MASKVNVCNQALSRIGIKKVIANIDTEKSEEAIQCRLWYDQCRQTVLQAIDWNRARRRASLAPTAGTPPTNWTYEYAYPAGAIVVRGLVLPGVPWPRKDQKAGVAFEAGNNGSVPVIYSNLLDAEAVWTSDLTDLNLWTPFMASALAYLIASEIAISLAVKPDMAKQARDGYAFMLGSAGRSNADEGETGPEPDNEYQAYRNG